MMLVLIVTLYLAAGCSAWVGVECFRMAVGTMQEIAGLLCFLITAVTFSSAVNPGAIVGDIRPVRPGDDPPIVRDPMALGTHV